MSYRRSRFLVFSLTLALHAAAGVASAQLDVPAGGVAPPATANAPVQDDDRLTRLAREFAGGDAPAADDRATIDRERKPLGGPAAERSPLPQAPLSTTGGSGAINTLGALGLIIALILVGRWGWMRFGGAVVARSTPAVEVLSRTSVAPRSHVLLVRVGGRILAVGESSAGLRTLTQIDEPDEVASLLEAVTAARPTSVTQGFAQLLSHNSRDFDKLGEADAGDAAEGGIDRARDSLSGLLSRVRTLSQRGGTS